MQEMAGTFRGFDVAKAGVERAIANKEDHAQCANEAVAIER